MSCAAIDFSNATLTVLRYSLIPLKKRTLPHWHIEYTYLFLQTNCAQAMLALLNFSQLRFAFLVSL